MKLTISFLHLEHTEALDERIKEKTAKLEKYFNGNITVKWNCFVKEGNHYAEVDIHGPHFDYHASAHTDSLYKTIDVAIDKIERQVCKKKEKYKSKRLQQNEELVILDPEMAWNDYVDDTEEVA